MVYKPSDEGSKGSNINPEAIQRLLAALQGGSKPYETFSFNDTIHPQYQGGNPTVPDANPFAQYFAGQLGGGPSSSDMMFDPKPYTRGKTEGPIHGPTIDPAVKALGELSPQPETEDTATLDAINALMQMAGQVPSGGGGIDIAGIMKKAAGAAAAPFNAQINTTRNQNQRAKADTKNSSKEIRKMYRALARSNNRAAGRESDQSMQSAQQIQDMSAASADELSADNASRLNKAAAQSAALGSGDLATTLSADINDNTAEGSRQITELGNQAATSTANRGEAERRYLSRQGQNMKLTGTNRAADLFGDLQDYLQGNRDKIGELRGQQAAAVGQARSAAASQAASAQSQSQAQAMAAHQQMLENQMALLGMKTGLQQQDFDNNLSQEELALKQLQLQLSMRPDSGEQPMIPGMDDRMLEALPDEQRSALMLQQFLKPESGDVLAQLMQNPALRSGYYTNKDNQQIPLGGNPLNSEQLLAELGLSTNDPQQDFLLSQIIAQLASANTDLPYGARRG